jgi:hypothetical protein
MESICPYIDTDLIRIEDNAEGCNSIEEVEAACLVDDLSEVQMALLQPYPNPAQDRIFISTDEPLEYRLLDIGGKCVQQGMSARAIELEDHPEGFYILSFYQGRVNYKLILN